MLQFNGALSAETVSGELSDKFKVISPPSNRVEGNEMWKSFKLTFAFCVENCFMLADSNKVESEFEYLNFATAYPDSKSVKVYRRFAVGTGI